MLNVCFLWDYITCRLQSPRCSKTSGRCLNSKKILFCSSYTIIKHIGMENVRAKGQLALKLIFGLGLRTKFPNRNYYEN